MAKILHTGDIHLDSAFSKLSDEDAKARRESLRRVFSKTVDLANDENVDVVLICGDIFDTYPIYSETADSFLRDLARLRSRVFIINGNHDPLSPDSPYRTLAFPDNVHIFTDTKLSAVEIPELSLRVFGAAYKTAEYSGAILDGFELPDDDFTNILMLHSSFSEPEHCMISESELEKTGVDYAALGHIHTLTDISFAGSVPYAYCGCPESRDFGECFESGVFLGDVSKRGINLRRVSVSDIRYRELSIDISNGADLFSLLPEVSGREFLRLTLCGETEPPNTSAISRALSSRYEFISVTDETVPPRNIWDGIYEDGLRGTFLAKMRADFDNAETDEERKKIELAVKYATAVMDNRDI